VGSVTPPRGVDMVSLWGWEGRVSPSAPLWVGVGGWLLAPLSPWGDRAAWWGCASRLAAW